MIGPAALSIRFQCHLLSVNRSTLTYTATAPDADECALIKQIDALHVAHPSYGSRKIAHELSRKGPRVNRKRVQRLMRLMGIESIAPKPNTSQKAPEHPVYPYLLKHRQVTQSGQVWASDITYIPLATGHAYLVAVIDWYSRRVLSFRLSNTMESSFCQEALKEALSRYDKPEIFNTDQGSQFTASAFTDILRDNEIKISMDGKGRYLDNIFIERVWRSLKYEDIHPKGYGTLAAAREGIRAYFEHYNTQRPHQALGYQTPTAFYETTLAKAA